MSTLIEKTRKTKETNIQIALTFCNKENPPSNQELVINTPVPFFTHMLHAMLFHGGWIGSITAEGDIEVDEHHLVEDVGIVLGDILASYAFSNQPIQRFGHAVIPMDDALGECTIDFSNRAFLNYQLSLPQTRVGTFEVALAREFFTSFAHNAHVNLHVESRYGINSHHILEAVFKATGKATYNALQPAHVLQSTKGAL